MGRPRTYPDSLRDEAARLYLSDPSLSFADVGRRLGLKPHTVRQWLLERGLASRKRFVTDEEAESFAALYQSGKPLAEIAAPAGVDVATVVNTLKSLGISRRSPSESRRLNNGHAVREDYFSRIETEEQAYWLGFLSADGCVREYEVKLSLQRRDRGHLLLYREALGSTAPVVDCLSLSSEADPAKRKPQSIINISSKRLAADLSALGVVQKKVKVLKPWDGPEHLMRHYWRGLVDGDGSIYRGKSWDVRLHGTLAVVEAFRTFVVKHFESPTLGKGSDPKYRTCWTVGFGGWHPVQTVIRLLYEGCTVALERKKALADELLSISLAGHPRLSCWRWLDVAAAAELYALHDDVGEAARALGVSRRTLRRALQARGLAWGSVP